MEDEWDEIVKGIKKDEEERNKNKERRIKYVGRIISLISPVLTGLNHAQISSLLKEVTTIVLETTVFTGVPETYNHLPFAQKLDQKEDVTNQQ